MKKDKGAQSAIVAVQLDDHPLGLWVAKENCGVHIGRRPEPSSTGARMPPATGYVELANLVLGRKEKEARREA